MYFLFRVCYPYPLPYKYHILSKSQIDDSKKHKKYSLIPAVVPFLNRYHCKFNSSLAARTAPMGSAAYTAPISSAKF